MIPLQQIIISFRDMIGKIQGTMTAGLFTLLGSYYTLQSLMGAIAQFLIIILIALAAMIILFWLIPFTWGAAISMTSIFVAISIPLAIMLAFMLDVLQVQPDLSIPTLQCFDKDTQLLMKDGTLKKISNVSVGDVLYYDDLVTAKIKVNAKNSIMYCLNNVIVSDTHLVHYKGKWIRVVKHPDAIKIDTEYNEPYLYCLNTNSKTIYINNTLFSDWDELVGNNYIRFTHGSVSNKVLKSSEIHQTFGSGISGNTQIKLQNEKVENIQSVKVGDILEKGDKVIGVIEIHGKSINKQYKYSLGKNTFMKGASVLFQQCENDKNSKDIELQKDDKLYHLLTDTKFFYIDEIKIGDYNAIIDSILEKCL